MVNAAKTTLWQGKQKRVIKTNKTNYEAQQKTENSKREVLITNLKLRKRN